MTAFLRIACVTVTLAISTARASAQEATPYPGLTFHAPPKALASGAATENWPHFLGPHFDATTQETKLLRQWPKDGPVKVWEMATGDG